MLFKIGRAYVGYCPTMAIIFCAAPAEVFDEN